MILKEPIIAYRAWRIRWFGVPDDKDAHLLYPACFSPRRYGNIFVPRQMMTAVCHCKSYVSIPYTPYHALVPNEDSESRSIFMPLCGIYAFKNPKHVLEFLWEESIPYNDIILGSVALWGRVQECQDGYRAQFAYPQSFLRNGECQDGCCNSSPRAKEYADAWAVDLVDNLK